MNIKNYVKIKTFWTWYDAKLNKSVWETFLGVKHAGRGIMLCITLNLLVFSLSNNLFSIDFQWIQFDLHFESKIFKNIIMI